MLHQYRVKLTAGQDCIVDGRYAIPVSIFMAAGTITGASGIDQATFGPPVAQTITAGSVSPVDPTKLPISPWYKFTPTGGGGCIVMQERVSR
ncbi:MAG: hypothetical protein C5B60_03890 [Chloroflexi bacterium]|nr:MAG: hypothetical protein C5B60_03890 [Chloroflexota bacterium]